MKYDFANIMLLIGSILVTLGLLLLLIDIILFGYNNKIIFSFGFLWHDFNMFRMVFISTIH